MYVSQSVLPWLISGIITLFLVYKVYFENPKRIQNRIFVLQMLGFSTLCISAFFTNLSTDIYYILFIGRIFYLAAILTPVFFLHFSFIFPEKKVLPTRERYFIHSQYLLCGILYVYFIYHLSVSDCFITEYGNYVYFNSRTYLVGIYISLILIFAVINLFKRYIQTTPPIEKQQIRNVFYGGALAVLIVILHIVLLFFDIKTYFMIPIAISIFSLFITAAILKFNLFIYKPMSEMLLTSEAISRLNRDELEKEVKARTIELIRTNERLKKEIVERRNAEKQLKRSLEGKEILLKEIHHRVKNNLQIISSLIYLQTRKIQDDKTNESLNEINSRIRSIALIHENIYKSDRFDKIDFNEYVHTIIQELFSIYKINTNNIQIKININEVFLDIDTSILCGLIINELVTNAMKHAFPDNRKGEIVVETQSNQTEFIVIIRDNGVGLPKHIDIDHMQTLGLQLVSNLVKQLNGTLLISTEKWTEFRIILPKRTSLKEEEII